MVNAKTIKFAVIALVLFSILAVSAYAAENICAAGLNSSNADGNIAITVTASKRCSMVGEQDIILTASMANLKREDINASLLVEGASGYLVKSSMGAVTGSNSWSGGWLTLYGGSSKDITLYVQGTGEVRTGINAVVSYKLAGEDKSLALSLPIAFNKGICGDNVCSSWENQQTCCLDCGCSTGQKCNVNSGVCEDVVNIMNILIIGVVILIIVGGAALVFYIVTNPNIDPMTKMMVVNIFGQIIVAILKSVAASAQSQSQKEGKEEGKKGTLVASLPTVCPFCGSVEFSGGGRNTTCRNCGRTFRLTG